MMNSYIYVLDQLSRRYKRIRQLVYVYIDEIQPTLTVYIYRRIRIYRCSATHYLQRMLAHMYTTNSLVDVPVSLIHMYTYTYVYIYIYMYTITYIYMLIRVHLQDLFLSFNFPLSHTQHHTNAYADATSCGSAISRQRHTQQTRPSYLWSHQDSMVSLPHSLLRLPHF